MVSDCFRIRTANLSDLTGISEVERVSFMQEAYPSLLLEKLISDHQSVFLVQVDSLGKIVGYCVSKNAETSSHLISVAVLPPYRRTGIAARMITELLTILRKLSINEVRLEVRMDNVPAIRLYQRLGFTKESVVSGYYSDGSDALTMGKIL
jgi:ribosomal-protein-alanine N-acetyltransferase